MRSREKNYRCSYWPGKTQRPILASFVLDIIDRLRLVRWREEFHLEEINSSALVKMYLFTSLPVSDKAALRGDMEVIPLLGALLH